MSYTGDYQIHIFSLISLLSSRLTDITLCSVFIRCQIGFSTQLQIYSSPQASTRSADGVCRHPVAWATNFWHLWSFSFPHIPMFQSIRISPFCSSQKIYPKLGLREGKTDWKGAWDTNFLGADTCFYLDRGRVSWVQAPVKIDQTRHVRYTFCCA